MDANDFKNTETEGRGGALRTSIPLVAIALFLGLEASVDAQDRIYVDHYRPLRSEIMVADADGSNPRKLLPSMAIDYNTSFSLDGRWVVFTSDRGGTADIFRARTKATRAPPEDGSTYTRRAFT